jgi:glucosamine-6-phosphate deaminase
LAYASKSARWPAEDNAVHRGEGQAIAFNEPGDTDFGDPRLLRVVALDERSRLQQVRDGCFETLEAVPKEAITLTVPAIMRAGSIVCVVPGPSKRVAIRQMLRRSISAQCPASVLRRHTDAALYADVESASEV